MTEGSKQPAKYTSDFNGLEKWFTHSIRRLWITSIEIGEIIRDDRNPIECVSTRERLDKFAADCTEDSPERAAIDDFNSSGLSQVVAEIKVANGKQIAFKLHQVEVDNKSFNTAVEALKHLLFMISHVRYDFYADKAYKNELYNEHKAEYGEEAAEDYWYSFIRLHVESMSEYGLNSETIDKLKEVFELQKFGYMASLENRDDSIKITQPSKLESEVEQVEADSGYTAAEAFKKLKISKSSFSKYRKGAGVKELKKGKKYSIESLIIIARWVLNESSANNGTKDGMRAFLKDNGVKISG